jgi:hypothetical protein
MRACAVVQSLVVCAYMSPLYRSGEVASEGTLATRHRKSANRGLSGTPPAGGGPSIASSSRRARTWSSTRTTVLSSYHTRVGVPANHQCQVRYPTYLGQLARGQEGKAGTLKRMQPILRRL